LSQRDRLFQVYGERSVLVELHKACAGMKLTGFIAALAEQGPTRGPQHVYINRRFVKDRTIAHAIIDAYSAASIKERSPEVHLFVEMPREVVDVNVHPTKAEVRFRDQSHIHQVMRRAIADTLGRGPAPELTLEPLRPSGPVPATLPLPAGYGPVVPSRWTAGAASAAPDPFGAEQTGAFSAAATGAAGVARADPAEASVIRPMMPLGQFRDTFIIAVDEEGIAIIDQHVAHERVLFERITERLTAGRLESQRLLEPLLVELEPSGRQALAAHAADLDRLGFDVEEFGGDSVRISAFPALLGREACDAALRALAEDLEGLDRGAGVTDALKRLAATMACHAAVKANYPLTAEKMAHILAELRRTAYSTVCPHGRPVMLRLTRREIEKNFERI
jgi:DNA mismatch repair protein MutL